VRPDVVTESGALLESRVWPAAGRSTSLAPARAAGPRTLPACLSTPPGLNSGQPVSVAATCTHRGQRGLAGGHHRRSGRPARRSRLLRLADACGRGVV